jgi:ABC-type bacteriocin/lantibiotic exporter with double-glycine peptidase domain
LNIGQFIAAEIVILLVLNSVEKLIINLDKVYDVLTSVEKLGKVTDKPVDMEGEVTMARVNRGMKVVTNSLSFQYDSSYVLKDVNFEVEAGKKIAVMGTDGSGKSTLLRLLSGVFPSYEGGLLIDDIPLRNYLGDSFRQQTGVLLQQQDIFLGPLLENITMGDDQVRPEDIMNLAARIGLSDFLQTQDEGFSTMLDPMGKRLSRSVIQKILLLRALINHPRLMLLEEPWRGLEEENRIRIQDFLLNESPASTVFVESNDETFARRADEIMVFEEGRLSYYGPWEDFVKMTHNQS